MYSEEPPSSGIDFVDEQQFEASQGYSNGLPLQLKAGIEELSGIAMDDVNVYTNSSKPAQFRAEAFAQGTDIYLSSGKTAHLPHEAWHVVQQKQGRVRPTVRTASNAGINDDASLEKEADVMGSKASGGALGLGFRELMSTRSNTPTHPFSSSVMQMQNGGRGGRRPRRKKKKKAPLTGSPLVEGVLTADAISKSYRIIAGSQLTNERTINILTSHGSDISDWEKRTTPLYEGGTGEPKDDYAVHFYYNTKTGEINTTRDYKKKFRDQRQEFI